MAGKKGAVVQLQTEVNTDEEWEKIVSKEGLLGNIKSIIVDAQLIDFPEIFSNLRVIEAYCYSKYQPFMFIFNKTILGFVLYSSLHV